MTRGIIIVGASGTLGRAVRRSLPHYDEIALFDLTPDTEDVRYLDLADLKSCEVALKSVDLAGRSEWRLLLAAGRYRGQDARYRLAEDFEQSIRTNLIGPAWLAYQFADRIATEKEQKCRIVAISSAAARVGSADVAYGTAKAGVEGAMRSISKAYSRLGVEAICVLPGVFESSMSAAQSKERINAAISSNHTTRIPSADEIAELVLFLLECQTSNLTGSSFSISGGQIA